MHAEAIRLAVIECAGVATRVYGFSPRLCAIGRATVVSNRDSGKACDTSTTYFDLQAVLTGAIVTGHVGAWTDWAALRDHSQSQADSRETTVEKMDSDGFSSVFIGIAV